MKTGGWKPGLKMGELESLQVLQEKNRKTSKIICAVQVCCGPNEESSWAEFGLQTVA